MQDSLVHLRRITFYLTIAAIFLFGALSAHHAGRSAALNDDVGAIAQLRLEALQLFIGSGDEKNLVWDGPVLDQMQKRVQTVGRHSNHDYGILPAWNDFYEEASAGTVSQDATERLVISTNAFMAAITQQSRQSLIRSYWALIGAGIAVLLLLLQFFMLMRRKEKRDRSKVFANDDSQKWRTLAMTDSLTGAQTRRELGRTLEREILRARHSEMPFSVIMLDLDEFKKYNDTFGHLAGDKALHAIVQSLQKTIREIDVVARYGGDEFVIVLIDTNAREAKAVANRCIEEIRNTGQLKQNIAASAGVVTCRVDSNLQITRENRKEIITEILRRADESLYQSKEKGRNQATVSPIFHVQNQDSKASS